jgi:hypothetical protein
MERRKPDPTNGKPSPVDFGKGRKPIHEFRPSVSSDGKFWILKYVTTWIVPVNYLDTIRKNGASSARISLDSAAHPEGSADGKTDDRTS